LQRCGLPTTKGNMVLRRAANIVSLLLCIDWENFRIFMADFFGFKSQMPQDFHHYSTMSNGSYF
jgi:hypothetical protein